MLLSRVALAATILTVFSTVVDAAPSGECTSLSTSTIGIDPVNNVGYMPIIKPDDAGNPRIAVVNLAAGVAQGTISLPGAGGVFGIAYNPNNQTMLVAAVRDPSVALGAVIVYVINTSTGTLAAGSPIATNLTRISLYGLGGILMDAANNRAILAGDGRIGILDTSTTPNTWLASDNVSTFSGNETFTLALNQSTGLLVVSGGGSSDTFDTTQTPPWTPVRFLNSSILALTIGVGAAFDPSTNMMVLTPSNSTDIGYGFNFNSYTLTHFPNGDFGQTGFTVIDGLGIASQIGQGPGGWASVNCATHQAAIADQNGQNIKLLQLPTAPITGKPDNNGQPYTGTTADANSAYTISSTLVAKTPCAHPLYIEEQPMIAGSTTASEGIAIDPQRNLLYLQADTAGIGAAQYLVRVDLSAPVFGGCPAGSSRFGPDTGAPCTQGAWNPAQSAIILPGSNDCPNIAGAAGSNQSAALGTAFTTNLQVKLVNAQGNPVSGATVTFTAPGTGAGGTFPGGVLTANTTTSASGVATAPVFTANSTPGTYLVTASAASAAVPAYFSLTNLGASVNVTLQTSPANLLVSLDGGDFVQAPLTQALSIGTTHTVATQSLQAGAAGTRYSFQSWSDNLAQTHSLTILAAGTFTATFSTQYQLTISASPVAGGTVTPGSGAFYDSGTVVPVTAAANAGYSFGSWTGNAASTSSSSTSVTMSAPETLTANFSPNGNGHPGFFNGEAFLSGIVYYLQIPNGNLFGYYEYLSSSILYHFDLGYEAFVPSTAGQIYFYDFASGHWWYTSPSLFPYLYDFTLNTFIYYFPDTKNAGHYTANPRYFSNLTTGKIFTM